MRYATMPADELVERVGISHEDAERHARAVFAALRRVIPSSATAHLAAPLSRNGEELPT